MSQIQTKAIANSAVTNLKVAAGIDATKIADGSISNTEFQHLNGVTSNIQTQLDIVYINGDLSQQTMSLANNQLTPANVTGVLFANGVTRSAQINYSIFINATSDLFESGTILAVQRGADWTISQNTNGDISQVNFSITSSGQLQYTTPNYAGFVSGTLKCRAVTTSI